MIYLFGFKPLMKTAELRIFLKVFLFLLPGSALHIVLLTLDTRRVSLAFLKLFPLTAAPQSETESSKSAEIDLSSFRETPLSFTQAFPPDIYPYFFGL